MLFRRGASAAAASCIARSCSCTLVDVASEASVSSDGSDSGMAPGRSSRAVSGCLSQPSSSVVASSGAILSYRCAAPSARSSAALLP